MTAVASGGHVRCGFEDQVELSPGRLAVSNAELIERVVEIAALAGREPATPAAARAVLGLDREPAAPVWDGPR